MEDEFYKALGLSVSVGLATFFMVFIPSGCSFNNGIPAASGIIGGIVAIIIFCITMHDTRTEHKKKRQQEDEEWRNKRRER